MKGPPTGDDKIKGCLGVGVQCGGRKCETIRAVHWTGSCSPFLPAGNIKAEKEGSHSMLSVLPAFFAFLRSHDSFPEPIPVALLPSGVSDDARAPRAHSRGAQHPQRTRAQGQVDQHWLHRGAGGR